MGQASVILLKINELIGCQELQLQKKLSAEVGLDQVFLSMFNVKVKTCHLIRKLDV